MRPLSEVPFSELAVGDQVLSAKGHSGQITEVIALEQPKNEDNGISIRWSNGKEGFYYHFECSKVVYQQDAYRLHEELQERLPVKDELVKKNKV